MSGFGEWLRAARRVRGLSRLDFARRIGEPHAWIHAVERGEQPPFSAWHAGPLAEALDLDPARVRHVLRLAMASWRATSSAVELEVVTATINEELRALGLPQYVFRFTVDLYSG